MTVTPLAKLPIARRIAIGSGPGTPVAAGVVGSPPSGGLVAFVTSPRYAVRSPSGQRVPLVPASPPDQRKVSRAAKEHTAYRPVVTNWTHDETARELETEHGVLRYHEAGDGPPLLLLHGSGPGVTGWRNFSGNLPTLAERFRCLVLEFPGFGVSHDTEKHPMVAAGPAVKAFLDGMGLEQVDIIGNSMGGMIGGQVAIAAPHRVRRLVTVGGITAPSITALPGEGIRLLAEFTDDPTRERLVTWLKSMVFDQSLITDEMVEERFAQATEPATLDFARRMYSSKAMAAANAMAAKSDRPPYWSMWGRIQCPTLITWGRDDRVSPVDGVLLPMRIIPDVQVHVFPNCGHWVMIEAKKAWEPTVLAFLGEGVPA